MTTSNLQLEEFGAVGVPSGGALSRNMRTLDVVVQLAAIAFATAAPAEPDLGDRYLVQTPATGAFTGHERHIASFTDAGWEFVIPENGWIAAVGASPPVPWVFNLSTQAWEQITASVGSLTQVNLGAPFFCPGAPTASQILLQFVIPQAWTIPANLSGSKGHIGTDPTGTWTASITQNGSAVGSIVVGISGDLTFTTTSGAAVQLAAGDVIRVIAPSSTDATIADISISLVLQQSVVIAGLTKWEGGMFFPGTPTSNLLLSKVIVTTPMTLPPNLSGSRGATGTNPTGAWSSVLALNGASIGTINCSTGGAFTFTTTGGAVITVAAGDVLEWEAPGSADATIANISVTLMGDVV